jgi:hypothetical protein
MLHNKTKHSSNKNTSNVVPPCLLQTSIPFCISTRYTIAKFQKLDKPDNFYKMKKKIKMGFILSKKSFILSKNLSYFRKIFHTFGKSFIVSENFVDNPSISCPL